MCSVLEQEHAQSRQCTPPNAVKKPSYQYRAVKHAQQTGATRQGASQAKRWKLSRYYGNPNMMVRKYNGYELGIYYGKKPTGQVYISTIWKRERR
jgi:hypothetical protein